MLGLDVWGGSQSQVQAYKDAAQVTFPLLIGASRSIAPSHDYLLVVGPDGTVKLSKSSLKSSISAAATATLVDDLEKQIPASVPTITVQQTAVDFGTIDTGQTGQQTITITNTGTAPLEITGILSDVSGLTFEPSTFTLSPNSSQTVTIMFPSSTVGTFSGNINISSNDPDRATQTLSVSVIVQPPPAPTIAIQEQSIDFGTIDAGQTGQQTITITNTGTATLEITGIESSDVPGLTFDPAMFTLEPDGSQTVMIAFPSSTAGTFSGNINILSNDPNNAKQTLSVSIIVKVSSANPKADFDGDGVVGITDFLLFVEAFGSTDSKFDIDGDGVVGVTDFLLFVEAFGKKVDG